MPHRCTFGNFTHRACAIGDLSNHDLSWIIPDPGSQQRVTLLLKSICTIPVQARASNVKMPELRQHSFNHGIPGFVIVLDTFWGSLDQPENNPGGLFRCEADIFSNITNCEIQRPGMLITRKIGQLRLVGCTYDWHNCRSCMKLIACIAPPIASVHLIVDSTTLRVRKTHWFKIEVRLKWEMGQTELYTFENIPVV